jgi:DNA-directed RNA polymerase beta' subunit
MRMHHVDGSGAPLTDDRGGGDGCSCHTCRLGYAHCPGHFGHVELCVPVYNPLVFPCVPACPHSTLHAVTPPTFSDCVGTRAYSTVVKLMRATCFHCHRIKMDAERVRSLLFPRAPQPERGRQIPG